MVASKAVGTQHGTAKGATLVPVQMRNPTQWETVHAFTDVWGDFIRRRSQLSAGTELVGFKNTPTSSVVLTHGRKR